MKILDIMSVPPVTVDMQDTVHRVEEILVEHDLSSVPVIDPERRDCFGIISLKDIAHFNATRRNPRTTLAWEMCTYKPLTVGPQTSIAEVGRMMVEHQIHHVVVVEDARIAGIVSSLDVIAAWLPPAAADPVPGARQLPSRPGGSS
jgi:CBS domain-containing protein